MPVETKYNADVYLRLSKQDGDNTESDSIGNQRALILDFLKSQPDITVHKIRIDDGFSGVDFNRPDFIRMIDDIRDGTVNCVVVKDFSRFGRNYIENGKYTQQLFPRTGVRFIAVNDCYDSTKAQGFTGNIIVPFKKMINDAYCADISTKVRSHLEIKRKNGEYVGAFVVYGYTKYESDKNRLVIDSFAADVVRDIYKWKLEGLSCQAIADNLNQNGVLSPMEYKRFCGVKFHSTFKVNATAKWQSVTVKRVLTNPVYIGTLEQGKRSKPNYKVRKLSDVPREQWTCHENAHDAIIEKSVFDNVQMLLTQDTRSSKSGENVRPLSGIIVCGDCNAAMVHKTTTAKGVKYCYYVCSNHRANTADCSTHIIATADMENAVLDALRLHTAAVLDIEKALSCAESMAYRQDGVRKLTAKLEAKRDEIKRYNDYRLSLYESYREGILPKDDFISFKASYDTKILDAETAVQLLKEEIERLAADESESHDWINRFRDCAAMETLERKAVAELVERVAVYEDRRIEVTFRYLNEFERLNDALRVPTKSQDFVGRGGATERSECSNEMRAQQSEVRDDEEWRNGSKIKKNGEYGGCALRTNYHNLQHRYLSTLVRYGQRQERR
jgi:DNA invertase Pin-like site-specific DNA recombinase